LDEEMDDWINIIGYTGVTSITLGFKV
jgi:hypothetical protein